MPNIRSSRGWLYGGAVLLLLVTIALSEEEGDNEPVNIPVNDGHARRYEIKDSTDYSKYHFVFGNHREGHDGRHVIGEYNLRESNGNVRTLKYILDKSGFHAQVINSFADPHFNASVSEGDAVRSLAQDMIRPSEEDTDGTEVIGIINTNRSSISQLLKSSTNLPSHEHQGENRIQPKINYHQTLDHPLQESNLNHSLIKQEINNIDLNGRSMEGFQHSVPSKYNNTQTNQGESNLQQDRSSQEMFVHPVPQYGNKPHSNPYQDNQEESKAQTDTSSQQIPKQNSYPSDSNLGKHRFLIDKHEYGDERPGRLFMGESENKDRDNIFIPNRNQAKISSQPDGNGGGNVESRENVFSELMPGKKINDGDFKPDSNVDTTSPRSNENERKYVGGSEDVIRVDNTGKNSDNDHLLPRKAHIIRFLKPEEYRNNYDESPVNVFKGENSAKVIDNVFALNSPVENKHEYPNTTADGVDGTDKHSIGQDKTGGEGFDAHGEMNPPHHNGNSTDDSHSEQRKQIEHDPWRISERSSKNVYEPHLVPNSAHNIRVYKPEELGWESTDTVFKEKDSGKPTDEKDISQGSVVGTGHLHKEYNNDRLGERVFEPVLENHHSQGGMNPDVFEQARNFYKSQEVKSSTQEEPQRRNPESDPMQTEPDNISEEKKAYRPQPKPHSLEGFDPDIVRTFPNVYKNQGVDFPSEVQRPIGHRPRNPDWIRDADHKTIFKTLWTPI